MTIYSSSFIPPENLDDPKKRNELSRMFAESSVNNYAFLLRHPELDYSKAQIYIRLETKKDSCETREVKVNLGRTLEDHRIALEENARNTHRAIQDDSGSGLSWFGRAGYFIQLGE